jgi:hypothetical protein
MYHLAENVQNGHKNTSILHCKTFQNLPKVGFWFENIPSGNKTYNRVEFTRKHDFFLLSPLHFV